MVNSAVKNSIVQFVKNKLGHDTCGHDWWHIQRVCKLAIEIAKKENANLFIVEISALLHDVCDHKICENQKKCFEELGAFLETLEIEKNMVKKILFIASNISYRGAAVEDMDLPIEGKIVMDADRLDAIGAIGIARAFAYGGSKQRKMYDPELKPLFHQSFEEYKNSQNTTVNHFYEKLLLLKNRMHTNSAKQMAETRHKYMEEFLTRFYNEWNGET